RSANRPIPPFWTAWRPNDARSPIAGWSRRSPATPLPLPDHARVRAAPLQQAEPDCSRDSRTGVGLAKTSELLGAHPCQSSTFEIAPSRMVQTAPLGLLSSVLNC